MATNDFNLSLLTDALDSERQGEVASGEAAPDSVSSQEIAAAVEVVSDALADAAPDPNSFEELTAAADVVSDALHSAAEDESLSEAQVEEGMRELRALLFSAEQVELADLRERIDNPQLRAQDLSDVLAEAVALRTHDGESLIHALMPNIESALEGSIRRDPQILADIFFPIIGPAIRKSIAAALQGMTQSLNETLTHSLSAKSVQWRIEAARTGKSFAEIVLLNTLLYRVEQVFLIHRETGLLLQHVAAHEVEVQDADMVSGMLTAIQDFARDSFAAGAHETLETVDIGELTVWVVPGPLAVLAGAIRGAPPEELRDQFRAALERIHREKGALLAKFNGDIAPFEMTRHHLENCLETRYDQAKKAKAEVEVPQVPKRKRSPVPVALFGVLVASLLMLPVFFHFRAQRRWNNYVETLRREPGIVVAEDGVRDGDYYVAGLRDSLAEQPEVLLRDTGIDPKRVRFAWQSYQSLESEFVLPRARRMLNPPPGVALQLKGETLQIRGTASREWIRGVRWAARFVPGVSQLDDDNLKAQKE